MRFANSDMLVYVWLLLPILAIMLFGYRRKKRAFLSIAKQETLGLIAPGFHINRRLTELLLTFAALCLIFFALLRPQWGFEWVVRRDLGRDLVVVLDVSDSMRATDLKPTRLERARREIVDLLKNLQGERIGLVAFAGASHLLCPLTLDYDAFTIFLDYIDTDLIPIQGTNVGEAINTAVSAFDTESAREKSILLITDGEDHQQNIDAAINKTKEAAVKIFVVGIGSQQGAPIPVKEGGGFRKDVDGNVILTKLNEASLSNIAKATGGSYVRSVAGDLDLDAVYNRGIAAKAGSLGEDESQRKRFHERFQLFLFLGILVLAINILLPQRKRLPAGTVTTMLCLMILYPQALFAGPLKQGVDAYRSEKYEESLNNFSRGQVDDPDNPAIQFNLGNSLYRLNRLPEAVQAFRKAAETEDPLLKQDSLYNLGNALLKQQQLKEAIESYEKALAIEPNDSDAEYNLELAKKLLEQQQKQQQQDQDNNDDKKADNQQQNQQNSDNDNQQQPNENNEQQQAESNNSDPGEQQPDDKQQQTPQDLDAAEAKQWLATINEDAKEAIKDTIKGRMWQRRPPNIDW